MFTSFNENTASTEINFTNSISIYSVIYIVVNML